MIKVIVIGNAPTLLLNSFGKEIDSYDTIIRLNDFEIEGWEQYVGTRTTIHARATNYEYKQRSVKDFDEIWLKSGWRKHKQYRLNAPYDDMQSSNIEIMTNVKHMCSALRIGDKDTFRSKSMGFVAIETAISKYYSEGNPIHILGFNLLNVKENRNIIVDRPHYYKNEPPNVHETHRKTIGLFNHDYILERSIIKEWIKDGKVHTLFADEIFNDDLDLSHLEPCVRVTPSHLIGKVNPATNKKYK